jgi:G3E family GTPase
VVPLIVLTGFLGAGKTTLLNELLRQRAASNAPGKIGVVVNELGEVGIDGALIGDARQIELPGGCVCCVLGDDLDRTLIDLVESNPSLDAIVLETTGVAEPLPIAWAVAREPVNEKVRLAAVVTVVDALNFRASRKLSAAVDAQVAYADVILITKAALAGEAETVAATSDVRTLASQAVTRIGETADHVAWLSELLLDPRIDRLDRSEGSPNGQDHGHVHDEECRHLDKAVHGIDSVWTHVHGVVDLEELEDALSELPGNYVRIKGIVEGVDPKGKRGWFAVHRVGLRVSSEPVEAPAWQSGRVVALGTNVAVSDLDECVRRGIAVRGA